MKLIYMEQTLIMLMNIVKNPTEIQSLIQQGTLKETKNSIKYLVIESKIEDNEK